MKLKSHVLALAATAAVGIAGVVTQVVVAAPERPAALQALEKQGVTIVGTFPAPGGLTAWAGYIGQRPPTFAHIPFGGGTRRCVGAAFANVEMDIVLRTVLRHFVIETTAAPGEKMHSRGVAYTPKDGGRVVMRRR